MTSRRCERLFGNQLIGLPVGSLDVQIAEQTETVRISEGKITDF